MYVRVCVLVSRWTLAVAVAHGGDWGLRSAHFSWCVRRPWARALGESGARGLGICRVGWQRETGGGVGWNVLDMAVGIVVQYLWCFESDEGGRGGGEFGAF